MVYELHYHFVFTTKYRKPVLRGDVGKRLRELTREICRGRDIEIVKGHVRPDHVHLFVSMPPHMAPSDAMKAIKGRTAHKLLREFRRVRRELWGGHLWSKGLFVCTSGNVTDDVVAEYVANHDLTREDEDFEVSDESGFLPSSCRSGLGRLGSTCIKPPSLGGGQSH
jgi:putative transposase